MSVPLCGQILHEFPVVEVKSKVIASNFLMSNILP